jgi:hypothetical protein
MVMKPAENRLSFPKSHPGVAMMQPGLFRPRRFPAFQDHVLMRFVRLV